jgi:hypothetical protein
MNKTMINFRGELVEIEFYVVPSPDGFGATLEWYFVEERDTEVTEEESKEIVDACCIAQFESYLATSIAHEP